jgi:hypothetical protein
LSCANLAPKIIVKLTCGTATMLNLILNALTRLLSPPGQPEAPPASASEDHSWHGSSFELARWPEVIEHRGAPPLLFSETPPVFDPPKA